jgi:hypothetical protein
MVLNYQNLQFLHFLIIVDYRFKINKGLKRKTGLSCRQLIVKVESDVAVLLNHHFGF